MPTFERLLRFDRDWQSLDPTSQARFREKVVMLAEDLGGRGPRPDLRIRAVQGAPGILELPFAPDGRATVSVAPDVDRGPHLIWRRIGVTAGRRRK